MIYMFPFFYLSSKRDIITRNPVSDDIYKVLLKRLILVHSEKMLVELHSLFALRPSYL